MKRKATFGCALLLALAAIAGGCSSPQYNRIDADRELYESWPLEIRQAVLDGRAEVGMTPEMVKMALGKPTEIVAGSSAGGEEIWVYRKGGEQDMSTMGYPGSYPSTYPGGYPGTYPGSMGGTGIGVSPSIGIGVGPGGPVIGTSINPTIGIGTAVGPVSIGTGIGSGMGTGMGGMGGMGTGGVMMPMPAPAPAPVVEREVVFRNGVVFRADNPEAK